ncbi:hypothetical protein CHUAL_000255 [Chamberlinius hualienensis]
MNQNTDVMEEVGNGRVGVDREVYEPTYSYDEVFPALPESNTNDMQQSMMGQWSEKMKVNRSVITQVFNVPVEERRYKEFNEQFGGQGEQAKICAEIMQKTEAHIEISLAKDQSLTILVTGKPHAVAEARRMIMNSLQTQAVATVSIPKDHHRFIMGKNGKFLKELEMTTATKITIPRADENSDIIKIMGTKENVDKARHEIQIRSDEQAKLAFERLPVPKIYHPFLLSSWGDKLSQLAAETGARINIPPQSVNKDEITVAGEKDAVMRAKEHIMRLYEEKSRKCSVVQVNVKKNQHKYIMGRRGTGIHEIMNQTGVSVEMPTLSEESDTITLRGEQDKLGAALTLVYAKANSVTEAVVVAPSWLHKYIIGRKGENIRQLTDDLEDVHVEFDENKNQIYIEGPHEVVSEAQKRLNSMAEDVMNRLCHEEIRVNPKYHKHIIGKNGANVRRIKQDTGVLISVPSNESSDVIQIEGGRAEVAKVKQEIVEMAKKMENEITKTIVIDQAYHRAIIGARGENIRDIRDRFNQVNITLPDAGDRSNVVVVRGPMQDVDMCCSHLSQISKELIENNYKLEVPIYKQFHKFIIGKGGVNIKKIRDETGTKIELPAEGSESDVIVITGKQPNVELAQQKILAIQNELDNIITTDIIIPAKFHNSIIGVKGRLIHSIMKECGGVRITFPKEGVGSDKVTIRGPKEDVDKAKKQLVDLTNEKQLSSFTAEIKAKPEHHKFLIGRNGVNIKKVRDKTGARIIFPNDNDEDRESITIMGRKEAVLEAKNELESLVKGLDNVVETEIKVDPKYHRHFVAKRGQVLRDLADEFDGVTVSFPRSGVHSETVVLKGAKNFVEGAKQKILDIVADLEQRITIECVIPQKYHRTVMGAKGSKVQAITQEFDVQIKFPDREIREENDESQLNGEVNAPVNGDSFNIPSNENEYGESDRQSLPKKTDVIKITGRIENCERAKEALLQNVPITEEITVPFDYHRYIIGQRGKDVREMKEAYDVNISVPPATDNSNTIVISGPPSNVAQAKKAIAERVEKLEKEAEDRALRSFKLPVEVDPKYHPKIIGRKGAVISKIRQDFDVHIQLPEKGDSAENIIVITGYEKNATAARDAIMDIVSKLEDMVTEQVLINHQVHSRLIGSKGYNIHKIMDEYKVDIRFPRDTDENPDMVSITGMEEQVMDAKEHLQNLEEEYLQDLSENEMMRQYTMAPSRQHEEQTRPIQQGFVVKGGPWEQKVPDTTSSTEFPSFGAATNDTPKPVSWGPRGSRFK